MSDRIIPVSWKVFEKFLFSQGCEFKRQKGDHLVYTKSGLLRPVIVPKVNPVPIFIIKNNLRTLGVSREVYLEWFSQ